jgi:hypothetical protein
MPSTFGPLPPSALRPVPERFTTSTEPPVIAIMLLYEPSATASLAFCTAVYTTTRSTTRRLRGGIANRNFPGPLDKLRPWDV